MTKLEDIEKAVTQLSAEELEQFRAWFEELQEDLFDARIEADIKSGKLDKLFDEARAQLAAGKSIKLP